VVLAPIDRYCGSDRGLHHVPTYLPTRSSTRRGQLSGRGCRRHTARSHDLPNRLI
jgi:hypothetical protein